MEKNNPFHIQIEDFRRYLAAEKGLSVNTIDAYLSDVDSFTIFLKKNDLKEINAEDIINFLSQLKALNYASSSISRGLFALKVFFRFLHREKYIEKNIAANLESPKISQLLPQVLSYKEVESLLSQPDTKTARGACDKALIEVMYGCGLRVSELCSLNLYDVDDEFVRVFGKGGKERIIPIGKKAIQAVDYYLAHFRGKCEKESDPLFINTTGNRMDRVTVWNRIKDYAKKANIRKNISPHTLRHAFATHLLDNGADLRVIQEMMGHSHIGSTDKYMHVSRKKLQEKFFACHPRN
ncbi:MAG: site-specific tyrosine recombinase XerD [Parachlamydiales bacterium]|jgi:integrase/recombinase XerD